MNPSNRRVFGVPPLGIAASCLVALVVLGGVLYVDHWIATLSDESTPGLRAPVRRLVAVGGIALALSLGALAVVWFRSASRMRFATSRQRLIHDRSPLYYHAVGPNLVLRDVNRTECDALGYSYDELVRRPLADISPDAVRLIESLAGREATATSLHATAAYRTRTGDIRDVEVTVLADNDEQDGPRWLMLAQDVTDQLRAEREHTASRQRLQELSVAIESLDEGLVVLDGGGNVRYANPAARRLIDPKDLGINARLLDDLFAGNEQEPPWAEIRDAVARKAPWSREMTPAEDPLGRLTLSFAGESRREGDEINYLLLVRDVSNERRLRRRLESSQRKYQVIFDQAPTGILAIDRLGNILDANTYYRKQIAPALESSGDTGGQSVFHHPGFLQRGSMHALNQLIAGREILMESIPVLKTDGHLMMALTVKGVPEIGDAGSVKRAYLFIEDVTAAYKQRLVQEKRTQDLEGEKNRAVQANRLKSQFLATISHELRTPLNAVIGFSRLVARKSAEVLEAKQQDNLRKIEDSGQKLLRLVNDLLDVSRIEAGHLEIHTEVIALQPFFDDIRREAEPMMEQNANRLECAVPNEIGRMETDPLRLQQVLLNLLGNAAKFTQQGEVRLDVRARAMEGSTGNDWIEMTVSDTGVGIPDDKREEIFQEFFQVDGSASRRFAGTGLGLTISRRLVELMGGQIEVASREGSGSSFTIRLPRMPLKSQPPRDALTRAAGA